MKENCICHYYESNCNWCQYIGCDCYPIMNVSLDTNTGESE